MTRQPSNNTKPSPPSFRNTTFQLLFLLFHTLQTTTTSSSIPSSIPLLSPSTTHPTTPLRIAYQGEPGAYCEKATHELLGPSITTIALPDFESCYRAVTDGDCDYACIPIENSLGGSVHDNYDLMLRYDELTIVAEHESRVRHCFLVQKGVSKQDVRYVMSHPQALAQCDGYLRSLGVERRAVYDSAGAAKSIAEGKRLPEGCTPANTAVIASDLAGKTYGLECLQKGIDDDDSNFTRYLLLGRQGVLQHLSKKIPCKTSIVFTLPNTAGALYKALACFSLRDIDFSKIESRPTSASLLSFLRFRRSSTQTAQKTRSQAAAAAAGRNRPRFRYCFYLDFLACEMDESAQSALRHLREQADFCRVLGSYPQKSRLVGPVKDAVEVFSTTASSSPRSGKLLSSSKEDAGGMDAANDEDESEVKLKIGIVGFGSFGRFLAKRMVQMGHKVSCMDTVDKSNEADAIDVEYYPSYSTYTFLQNLDVVLLSVPMSHFQYLIESQLPTELLHDKLVVELCPLSTHPKSVLLSNLPPDTDIVSALALFGPKSTTTSHPSSSHWDDGLPLLYEKVRIRNPKRFQTFLSIFAKSRCKLQEMTAEQQDACCADAEFITHLTGRLLHHQLLPPTLVASKEYTALLDVADATLERTFEFFYGLFEYNPNGLMYLNRMKENLAKVEKDLAAKEAYLAAKKEMQNEDRGRLIEEVKMLLREVVRSGRGGGGVDVDVDVDGEMEGGGEK